MSSPFVIILGKKHNIFLQKRKKCPKARICCLASENILNWVRAALCAHLHEKSFVPQRSGRLFRRWSAHDASAGFSTLTSQFRYSACKDDFFTQNFARLTPFLYFRATIEDLFYPLSDRPEFLHYFSKIRAKFGKKPIVFYTFSFFEETDKKDKNSIDLLKKYKARAFCFLFFVYYFHLRQSTFFLVFLRSQHFFNIFSTFLVFKAEFLFFRSFREFHGSSAFVYCLYNNNEENLVAPLAKKYFFGVLKEIFKIILCKSNKKRNRIALWR